MARSVRFYQTGGPEVLRLEDVAVPEPGIGEIRLRVRALGLNRAEAMYRSGAYVIDPVFPAQLGYEAAGTIDAIGPDVSGLAIGDAVSVVPAFSFLDYGLYGELVLAPARAVVKHPSSLDWRQAAAVWMPFATAWGALVEIAALAPADVLLIPAASSSVGLAAIQIALQAGAVPVALTRTSAKSAELTDAGVAHVVATDEQDVVAEVMRITGGRGARVAFDPVGGPNFARLAQATAVGGIIIVYGALSTDPTLLPVLPVLGRHLTIRGYELFEVTMDDAKLERLKRFVIDGMASGALSPRIARSFPLEQIVEAHHFLESNAQVGKVVIDLD